MQWTSNSAVHSEYIQITRTWNGHSCVNRVSANAYCAHFPRCLRPRQWKLHIIYFHCVAVRCAVMLFLVYNYSSTQLSTNYVCHTIHRVCRWCAFAMTTQSKRRKNIISFDLINNNSFVRFGCIEGHKETLTSHNVLCLFLFRFQLLPHLRSLYTRTRLSSSSSDSDNNMCDRPRTNQKKNVDLWCLNFYGMLNALNTFVSFIVNGRA